MTKPDLTFALITGLIVTSYITFTLVAVNIGFENHFLLIWLRSWLIAYILAVPSLLFVAPFIRKKLNA
jgi:predicted membrane channel-forming protein YqfA (hemolysin III family)